jgi:hypothetical protein
MVNAKPYDWPQSSGSSAPLAAHLGGYLPWRRHLLFHVLFGDGGNLPIIIREAGESCWKPAPEELFIEKERL